MRDPVQKRLAHIHLVVPHGVGVHMMAHHMRDAPFLRRHYAEIEVVHTEVVSHMEVIMRRDRRPRQENP